MATKRKSRIGSDPLDDLSPSRASRSGADKPERPSAKAPKRARDEGAKALERSSAKAPEGQGASAPGHRGKSRHVRKSDGLELTRIHPYIPVTLDRTLAIYCATSESDQSLVVTEALTQWLAERGVGKPATR